jgi:hypothetical protein
VKKLSVCKAAAASLLALAITLLGACGGDPAPAPVDASKIVFAATPPSILAGSQARLVFAAWPSTAKVSIDQGIGDVTGKTEVTVSPTETTTYTLTATSGSSTGTASVTVVVAGPSIKVFAASPGTITSQGSAKLLFAVDPADAAISIDQGVGSATGKTEVTVSPKVTTTYTLTATRGGHSSTATTKVTVVPIESASLRVTSAGSATAGDSAFITVTALQADGSANGEFRGAVHLACDDPGAVLPADLVFGQADGGSRTAQVAFKRAGPRTVSATAVGAAIAGGSVVVQVAPAVATSLALSPVPGTVTAGTPFVLRATMLDGFGNVASGYAGTLHFASSDKAARLPPDTAFSADDAGVRAFDFTLGAAGSASLTVADTANTVLTASVAVAEVKPGAARSVQLTGVPAAAAVDAPVAFTATLFDAYGNQASGFTGALQVALSDAAAPSANALVFAAADHGSKSGSAVYFTAGLQTLGVKDAVGGLVASASVRVAPGPLAAYSLAALPGTLTAGAAVPLTLRALDAHQNLIGTYAGSVAFTSTDPAAALPGTSAFSGGVLSASAVFKTAGARAITVTEQGGAHGASQAFEVVAGAPASLAISGLVASGASDQSLPFAVTARDASGNTINGPCTVSLNLSDATVPALAAVTAAAGAPCTGTRSAVFFKAGPQSVAAALGGTALTASAPVAIRAGAATALLMDDPAPVVAGAAVTLRLSAFDAHQNPADAYAGAAVFTSSDAQAVLPGPAAFAGGKLAVTATFNTAGARTVTASEQGGALTVSRSLTVAIGAPASLSISGLAASGASDQSLPFTVTARDASGNTINGPCTVSLALSDAAAPALAAVTAAAGAPCTGTRSAVFFKAGPQSVTAALGGGALTATAPVAIGPGALAGYAIAAPGAITAGAPVGLRVSALDAHQNLVTTHAGTANLTSTDARARIPASAPFVAGVLQVSAAFFTAGAASFTASEAGGTASATVNFTTGWAAPARVVVAAPGSAAVEASVPASVEVRDGFGNQVRDFAGTLHVALTDLAAPVVSDLVLAPADLGAKSFSAVFFTSGPQSITVTQTGAAAVTGSTELTVTPGSATQLVFAGVPATSVAGSEVLFELQARDGHGNLDPAYSAAVKVSPSFGADATLGAFSGGRASGSVSLTKAATQRLTALPATGGAPSATSADILVVHAPVVFGGSSVTGSLVAGSALQVTLTATDQFGNLAQDSTDTVTLASTDSAATLPASYTFTAGDQGVAVLSAVMRTAGAATLTTTLVGGRVSTTSLAIKAAAASKCSAAATAVSSDTGGAFALEVKALDPFGNVDPTYAGLTTITSSDSAAVLQPAAAFVPAADAGRKVFGARLLTAGTQTLTATAAGLGTCAATVSVVSVGTHFSLALSTDIAGVPATVTVTAKDAGENLAATYNGTVTFTNTDVTASAKPANLALVNGVGTTSLTFGVAGLQTVTAAQVGSPAIAGSLSLAVKGLVYTDPASNLGKVRLVVNAANTTATSVALDLVHSNIGLGPNYGGTAYGVGFNLPVDTNRVTADSPLITETATGGTQLFTSTLGRVLLAALPTTGPGAGLLMTALSMKAATTTGTAVTADQTITLGRRYFTVKLKTAPTATAGVIFDGQALGATKFRAAVRSRAGMETVTQADFAIGKLEIK